MAAPQSRGTRLQDTRKGGGMFPPRGERLGFWGRGDETEPVQVRIRAYGQAAGIETVLLKLLDSFDSATWLRLSVNAWKVAV